MSAAEEIRRAVDQVALGLERLADLFADPGELSFDDVTDHIERLEEAIAVKAFVDSSFAWAAEQADAGRRVGSTRAMDYLIKRLGLSRSEALDRLNRGRDLFTAPSSNPVPAPRPGPGETEQERRRREAELEKIRAEEQRRLEEERRFQSRARDEARKQASAERQRIIQQELRHLSEHSDPSRAQLLVLALEEAKRRTPEDLRAWLRDRVRTANRKGRLPGGTRDPYAAVKKRSVVIGTQDADGGVLVRAYLPAAMAAKLKAALAPGRRPGVNASVPPEEDRRTVQARSADQLDAILDTYLADDARKNRHGVGSVVVSMTAGDLDGLTADPRFATNTGHLLSPADILQLGAAKFDLGVVHDEDGLSLHLSRTERSASLAQRLALFAQELCCTNPDCAEGMCDCDVHHLVSWAAGGNTDIENLTIICRPHHGNNNDRRDGAGGLGHMDKDPATRRTGWSPPGGGAVQLNETQFQQYSAGARIRSRRSSGSAGKSPPTGDEPSLIGGISRPRRSLSAGEVD